MSRPRRARGPILLLTHSADFYTIDLVESALHSRNVECLRINTDHFPMGFTLSQGVEPRGHELWLTLQDRTIPLSSVPAVWTRRLYPGRMPSNLDPTWAEACAEASRTMFHGVLDAMDGPHWVNVPSKMFAAENKLLQMRLAQSIGLRIPETLVTNDPALVEPFFRRHRGQLITKLLTPLSQSMQPNARTVYTSLVREEDLGAIADLQYAPQIFQPLIEKTAELRVIVVGRRFFIGKLDARSSKRGHLDWRRATIDEDLHWEPFTFPAPLRRKVLKLMDRLGLVYGALDFLLDDEGAPIFLEVNPAGEWGFLQKELGLPIAEAIAEELVEGGRR